MSSILEALKKLETDSIEKENSPFLWPHPVNIKSSLNKRLEKRTLNKIFSLKMTLIFFFVITLILLFIIFSQKNYRNQPEPVKTIPATKTDITLSPKVFAEKKEEGASTFVVVEPSKMPLIKPQEAGIKEELPIKKAEKIPLNEIIKDSAFETGVNKKPAKQVDAQWLKLHGISWSDNPARRMAVINSIVVREGKKIEGARVVRIDKKYVVIEKDGEELLLSFGQ